MLDEVSEDAPVHAADAADCRSDADPDMAILSSLEVFRAAV